MSKDQQQRFLTYLNRRETGAVKPLEIFDVFRGSKDFIQRLGKWKILTGHEGCVNTISWNERGDKILSGSDDCKLNIFHVAKNKLLHSIRSGHRANIFSAKFLPCSSDRKVVSCCGSGMVHYNEIGIEQFYGKNHFNCHSGTTYEVAVTPGDPNTFMTCGEDGTVREFDLRLKSNCYCTKCREDILIECQSAVTSLCVNPMNPCHLAIGCDDSVVRIYDKRTLGAAKERGYFRTSQKASPGLLCSFKPPQLSSGSCRVTSLRYSNNGEDILVSYSTDYVYLFSMKDAFNKLEPGKLEQGNRERGSTEEANDQKTNLPPIKRLRLRGDWSDTGPNARPESDQDAQENERGENANLTLMQRIYGVFSQSLEEAFSLAQSSDTDQEDDQEEEEEQDQQLGLSQGHYEDQEVDQRQDHREQDQDVDQGQDQRLHQEVDQSQNEVLDQEDQDYIEQNNSLRNEGKGSEEHIEQEKACPQIKLDSDPDPVVRQNEDLPIQMMDAAASGCSTVDDLVGSSSIEPQTKSGLKDLESEKCDLDSNRDKDMGLTEDKSEVLDRKTDRCESEYYCDSYVTSQHSASLPDKRKFQLKGGTDDTVRNVREFDDDKPKNSKLNDCQMQAQFSHLSNIEEDLASKLAGNITKQPITGVGKGNKFDGHISENTNQNTESLSTVNFNEDTDTFRSRIIPEACQKNDVNDLSSGLLDTPSVANNSLGPKKNTLDNCCDAEKAKIYNENRSTTDPMDSRIESNNNSKSYLRCSNCGLTSKSTTSCNEYNSLQPNIYDLNDFHSDRDSTNCSEIPGNSTTGNRAVENRCFQEIDSFPVSEADERSKHCGESPDDSKSAAASSRRGALEKPRSEAETLVAPDVRCRKPCDDRPQEPTRGAASTRPTHDVNSAQSPTARAAAATRIQRYFRSRKSCSEPMIDENNVFLKLEPKMCFRGHRNARTMIKEANFWGDNFVLSGSDCGRIFIWDRHTGELVSLLEGDKHVVNCVQPHPFDPVLATSGIDYDIKTWAPILQEPASLQNVDEIIRRNEQLLEDNRAIITIPASFMLRMLTSINRVRNLRRRQQQQEQEDDATSDENN